MISKHTPAELPIDLSSDAKMLPAAPPPLPADPWISVSALQKAIRRGDMETADRAALAVLRHRGTGLFRRLIVIAFEDIGIGAPHLLASMTRLCADARNRREFGTDEVLGRTVARALAAAPKERSTDYLASSVIHRPDWEDHRERAGAASIGARIAMAVDAERSLAERATAAWFASGIENGSERRIGTGDLPALLRAFADTGLPEDVVDAIGVAAKATKEPIVVMLAPLLQELARSDVAPTTEYVPVPTPHFKNGIPAYALDKHTRSGRQAIARFARDNSVARSALERHVPEFRRRDAAMLAAFYADATPISFRLNWDRVEELETLGAETDLGWAGIPIEGVTEVLQAFRSELDHLDQIRVELICGHEHAAERQA